MWDCEFEDRCLNGPAGKDECYRCTDKHLLSLPDDKARTQARRRADATATTGVLAGEDSWKQLEKDVANRSNANPYRTYQEAHRVIMSGGLWFAPGDVVDDFMLWECKERTQLTAGGEKSFTVQKDWLDKIIEEGREQNRLPGLCFRFKNDGDIYTVKPFDVELDMIHTMKTLIEENERLRQKLGEKE